MEEKTVKDSRSKTILPALAPMIVIGLTGLKAAGKDTLAERLVSLYGFTAMGFGDAVRREAKRQLGTANPPVAELIRLGNEGRAESGNGIWAQRLLEMARESGVSRLVMNGFRHPDEFDVVKSALPDGHFTFVAIVAPFRVRAERLIRRGRPGDPVDLAGFADLDDADRGIGQPWSGQQVDRAIARAAYANVYNNAGTLAEYEAWIDALADRALRRPLAALLGDEL